MDSPLLASLKRHNPSTVRSYASDDDFRDISVPTRRRRWSQVIEAIEGRAWTRVELLDKKGAVLGYVENTAPAGELESLPDGTPKAQREVERIAALVVNTAAALMRDVVKSRDTEVTALLTAQREVMKDMGQSMRELANLYREQVGVAADVAAARERANAAAGAPTSEIKELMEALPMLMQLIPLVRGLAAPSGSVNTGPTNGVRKES